jgi:hypothetical protein
MLRRSNSRWISAVPVDHGIEIVQKIRTKIYSHFLTAR